jgi:protein-S-isoprenylcysteine O-methyltransferase Ste14
MAQNNGGAWQHDFFALAPGVVAGFVPLWLTGWRVRQPLPSWAGTPLRVLGVALIAAGAVVLVQAFMRFVVEAVGVRNPMYLAVIAVIVGQAFVLSQPILLAYATAVGTAMAAFVYGYEEPALADRSAPSSRHTGPRCQPGGRAGDHGSRARPAVQAENEP